MAVFDFLEYNAGKRVFFDIYYQGCLVVHKKANMLALFPSKRTHRKLRYLPEVWLAEISDATNNVISLMFLLEKLSS